MNKTEKIEINEDLREELFQYGFAQKKNGHNLTLSVGKFEIVIKLFASILNTFYVIDDGDIIFMQEYDEDIAGIIALVKKHTGVELTKSKKYDWKSCILAAKELHGLDEDLVVTEFHLPNVNNLDDDYKFSTPNEKDWDRVEAFCMLMVVVSKINEDFPAINSHKFYPYYEGDGMNWSNSDNNIGISFKSLQGLRAFGSENSNVKLFKKFLGIL